MAPGDWYVQSLSWSPDGRRLAFGGDRTTYLGARRPSAKPADCGCVDVFDIFVVATGKTRRLTRTGVAGQPVWSPNGKEIAFVNSGAIMVMAAGGRHMRTVAAGYNQLFDWAVSPH
jgi:Tol biopolymer transport system component